MQDSTRTKLYLKHAWWINAMLRKFDLLLMAHFEGEPPNPPQVKRVWIQRMALPKSLLVPGIDDTPGHFVARLHDCGDDNELRGGLN